ncbi:2-amino-4-hydroxy-6-hydroxymethyldihydropteridine diphosphokinase [Desulfococcaceae bacterium HSG8]|nr:2-amino-4-hydroxy-6-hydroxymethyldihydropteridine diphosphokinase [Desulfococcaceae bacterium HSG8]
MQHTAYISAGSNIGNKLLNCQDGIVAITRSGKSVLRDHSRFYKTEPVDYREQDWFVNAAVKIETSLDPLQLLGELKSIEREAGRTGDVIRFGPRVLDLDILLYDDMVIKVGDLCLPHPRMHKRHCILKPVCDIAPHLVHPVLKKDMQYLLDNLDHEDQGVIQL